MRVSKGRSGWNLHHECSHCGVKLVNRVADIGKLDKCPACGYAFTVPSEGVEEMVKRQEAEDDRKRAEAIDRREKLQREKIRAAAEKRERAAVEKQKRAAFEKQHRKVKMPKLQTNQIMGLAISCGELFVTFLSVAAFLPIAFGIICCFEGRPTEGLGILFAGLASMALMSGLAAVIRISKHTAHQSKLMEMLVSEKCS